MPANNYILQQTVQINTQHVITLSKKIVHGFKNLLSIRLDKSSIYLLPCAGFDLEHANLFL